MIRYRSWLITFDFYMITKTWRQNILKYIKWCELQLDVGIAADCDGPGTLRTWWVDIRKSRWINCGLYICTGKCFSRTHGLWVTSRIICEVKIRNIKSDLMYNQFKSNDHHIEVTHLINCPGIEHRMINDNKPWLLDSNCECNSHLVNIISKLQRTHITVHPSSHFQSQYQWRMGC